MHTRACGEFVCAALHPTPHPHPTTLLPTSTRFVPLCFFSRSSSCSVACARKPVPVACLSLPPALAEPSLLPSSSKYHHSSARHGSVSVCGAMGVGKCGGVGVAPLNGGVDRVCTFFLLFGTNTHMHREHATQKVVCEELAEGGGLAQSSTDVRSTRTTGCSLSMSPSTNCDFRSVVSSTTTGQLVRDTSSVTTKNVCTQHSVCGCHAAWSHPGSGMCIPAPHAPLAKRNSSAVSPTQCFADSKCHCVGCSSHSSYITTFAKSRQICTSTLAVRTPPLL